MNALKSLGFAVGTVAYLIITVLIANWTGGQVLINEDLISSGGYGNASAHATFAWVGVVLASAAFVAAFFVALNFFEGDWP